MRKKLYAEAAWNGDDPFQFRIELANEVREVPPPSCMAMLCSYGLTVVCRPSSGRSTAQLSKSWLNERR